MNTETEILTGEGKDTIASTMYEIGVEPEAEEAIKLNREIQRQRRLREKEDKQQVWAGLHPSLTNQNSARSQETAVQQKDLELVVSKPRSYRIGKELGRGTWGRVFSARDQFGEEVAIKRLEPTELAQQQMEHRNLNPWRVLNNEAMTLAQSACSNIVPRRIEVRENGEPYIVMPQYKKFLSDVIHEGNAPLSLSYGLSMEQIIKFSRGISRGLRQIHEVLKRHYGDLKPDNIAIDDEGNALINDLGTTSIGKSISPRDHIGFEGTRAPEDWLANGKIDKRSDVYSSGSLFYRLFTGKYLSQHTFEEECGIDYRKIVDRENWERIKENIPREFRKFIRKCTHFEPSKRYQDAKEMELALDEIIENRSVERQTQRAKPWVLSALGIAAMAALAYYNVSTYEPKKLEVPEMKNYVQGELSSQSRLEKEEKMNLVAEDIPGLTGPTPPSGAFFDGYERYAKLSTENRNVAYMAKCFRLAQEAKGKVISRLTPNQEELFWRLNGSEAGKRRTAIVGEYWARVSTSIEYGLNRANIKGVGVDLEDALVIARLGEDTLKSAKKLSGSQDYKQYIKARYAGGEFVISEPEQSFINTWIYYIQKDPDILIKAAEPPLTR